MQHSAPLWMNPGAHLARLRPEHPVLYMSPETLQQGARRFIAGFPGRVTYAVKANDRAEVLDNLVAAGIGGFDVASPAEMRAARRAFPDCVLHYHNPVRSPSEIAAGIAFGARSWSVDDAGGLEALAEVPRTARIAVRFTIPLPGGAYDFGAKFGADPEEAAGLLRRVAEMGFAPALTFHPGTQCERPAAWTGYVAAAAQIAGRAGLTLAELNVGGGFPAGRDGAPVEMQPYFDAIAGAVKGAFTAPPLLVCEPGRALVAGAFTLAAPVKALRRGGAVVLADGVYGGLADLRDMPAPAGVVVLSPAGIRRSGAPVPRIVFGPTCDSLDRLPGKVPLPCDMEAGDHVLWPAMGAYSLAMSTAFNGYGLSDIVSVGSLDV